MKTNVADRPLSLAVHMREVAHKLSVGAVAYNWSERHSCNCGVLARQIMGLSESQLKPLISCAHEATWVDIANDRCSLTGITNDKAFAALFAAGLRFEDIGELERLSNPLVIGKMRVGGHLQPGLSLSNLIRIPLYSKVGYRKSRNLVAYLNAWATLIEEFHAARQPTEATMEATELRPLVPAVK